MRMAGRNGVFAEPAAAASLAAVVSAIDSKIIGPNDRVLVMIKGSGLKDTKNAIRAGGQPIAVEPNVAAIEEALEASRRGAETQSP
jgi:threonine synthase